ncbi:unnamed protein product [Prunus armeniaca]|uniref:Uncharacterized protein n=1 Tax=Prunus armeniaca TaxID=36596 RepID=A0A6J5W1Z2_PRUAR|nr:unnamed protein product [Prunus armeniaca]
MNGLVVAVVPGLCFGAGGGLRFRGGGGGLRFRGGGGGGGLFLGGGLGLLFGGGGGLRFGGGGLRFGGGGGLSFGVGGGGGLCFWVEVACAFQAVALLSYVLPPNGSNSCSREFAASKGGRRL